MAELGIVSALGADHSFVKSETGIPSLPAWHPLFTVSWCWELVGWEYWPRVILYCLIFLSSLELLEGISSVTGLWPLLSCVGLWMLGPFSPSCIRLGKMFRILKLLIENIHPHASDRVAQRLKRRDQRCSGPLPCLAFPQLRPVAFGLHVAR